MSQDKIMKPLQASIKIGIFSLALLLPLQAQAIALVFSPTTQSVEVGQAATVDVFLTDLSGHFVGAFDFFVNYDASVLGFNQLTFGNSLGGPLDSLQTAIDNPSAGQVNAAELSFLFDLSFVQNGISDLLLFSLTFDTLSAGTSLLSFSENIFGLAGGFVGDELGFNIPLDVIGTGQITVTQPLGITEPPLFMFTLMMMAWVLAHRQYRVERG